MPEPADLTFVGSTAWVAPNSNSTISPNYPSGLSEGDVVYAVHHLKPNTATIATPTDWSVVGSATGGGGSQGAGTGQTKMQVFKRTVPAGGLSGSQAFSITGGSSPVAHMQAWRGNGVNIVWDTETLTFYSRATGSTAFGGTGAANLTLGEKDALVVVVGSPDDQSSNINITSLSAAGTTLNALTKAPDATQNTNATITNSFGSDISAASAYATIASGTSSAAPVVTAAGNSSETGMGLFFRVSAQRDPAVIHEGTASLTVTADRSVDGAIIVIHSGEASRTTTATVTADAVVTGPQEASPVSSEPGYAQPGAMWVGSAWTTAEMGGSPTVEAQAELTITAATAAASGLVQSGAASLAVTATGATDGEWWGAVRGLTADPISTSRIDLEWDPVFGATGYDVERDGVVIAEDVAGLSYSDVTGLVASTEYDYRVAAVPVQ
jgi:hypothetical protein